MRARFLGEQIFFFKSERARKFECAFANQEHVVGLLHDGLGDFRGRLDIAQRADRAAATCGSMHAARVQLDDSLFIGQTAVSDAGIARIELDNVDASDHRVKRVAAGLDRLNCLRAAVDAAAVPVGAGDGDDLRSPLRREVFDDGQRGRAEHDGSPAEIELFHDDLLPRV